MPDASGRILGIALTGKAGESWERIFGKPEPAPVGMSESLAILPGGFFARRLAREDR